LDGFWDWMWLKIKSVCPGKAGGCHTLLKIEITTMCTSTTKSVCILCIYVEETILEHLPNLSSLFISFAYVKCIMFFGALEPPLTWQNGNIQI